MVMPTQAATTPRPFIRALALALPLALVLAGRGHAESNGLELLEARSIAPAAAPALHDAIGAIETRLQQLAERARSAVEEAEAHARAREEAERRIAELEARLADSEAWREQAELAAAQAEALAAEAEAAASELRAELAGVHGRLAQLAGLLDRLGIDGATLAPNNETAPVRGEVTAMLAALGAERVRHGILITIPGQELFGFDSDEIEPGAHKLLDEVAEVLGHFPDRLVVVVGHTDSMGDPAYNHSLSERRAAAVRDFLVTRLGTAPEQMTVVGAGDSRPVASNTSPQGRAKNRRVEIVIHEPEDDQGPLAGTPGGSLR